MKKQLLKTTMIAVITVVIGTAKAQLSYFGRAGMNLSSVTVLDEQGAEEKGFSNRIGFQIGGGVDYSLNDNMGVEISALYAQRGTTYAISETDAGTGMVIDFDTKMTFHYIDIPINFRYSVEMGDGKLNILAGPKFGLGLSGKWTGTSKVSFLGQNMTSNIDEDLSFGSSDTNDLKTLDLGVGLGVGYEISNFHFVASYHYGFTNHDNSATGKESMKQNMISFTVGYRFGDN